MMVIGIYGASGCGRGIMPLARVQFPDANIVFIDDGDSAKQVNGHAVCSWGEFLDIPSSEKKISLAIANGAVRERLALKCAASNIESLTITAQSCIIMDNVTLGDGAILSPFVTLTSNIEIGRHFHANLYSYVEHDCVIGDFVTFGPRVCCNGNVVIEDHTYIGAGAILRQGTPDNPLIIGRGAVVGMGAVVTKNVAPGITVVGCPAKPISRCI